jgi:hypothetical protein
LIIRSHILYVFYCAGITCLAAFIHPPLLHPRLHFSRARCSSAHVMACTTVSSLSEFEWHGPVISHWHSRIGQRLKSNLGRRVYIRANSANSNRNSSTFSATVRVGTLRASLGVEVCTVDWISRASRTSLYGVHYYRPTLTKSPTHTMLGLRWRTISNFNQGNSCDGQPWVPRWIMKSTAQFSPSFVGRNYLFTCP